MGRIAVVAVRVPVCIVPGRARDQRAAPAPSRFPRPVPHPGRAERPPSAMARIFVACYPPPATARTLLAELGELELPEHRPTTVDQLHLTLQFVGNVHPKQLEALVETVERAAAGVRSFRLEPDRLTQLPQSGPARLVAALAPAPSALLELHKRLASRLLKPGRGAKSFLPHLTLARFGTPQAGFQLDHGLELEGFEVDEIAVMESRLRPEGAEHRCLKRVGLPG